VLAGLELLRTLNDHNVETERDVVLVNWTNEEGARFAPAMLSSGVWTGSLAKHTPMPARITMASPWAKRWRALATGVKPCPRVSGSRLLRAAHRTGADSGR
jgi:hypothetical protein